MVKKLSLLILSSMFGMGLPLIAQTNQSMSKATKLQVAEAGQLEQSVKDKHLETPLSGNYEIEGEINLTDFRFLRQQRIDSLSLENVSIVAGGNYTNESDQAIYGQANEIPDNFLFASYSEDPDNKTPLCKTLKYIVLPESVQRIGERAFQGSLLSYIDLPGSLKNIGNMAFGYNKNLETIGTYCELDSIGIGAFEECIKLMEFRIPETVRFIGGTAFKNCEQLEEIELPNSLEAINYSTFEGCKSLESVVIAFKKSQIKEIGMSAFEGCSSLTGINLGFLVSKLGKAAFKDCQSLENISMPCPLIKEIPSECFFADSALVSIQLPANTEVIGFQSFNFCKKLKRVVWTQMLKEIGNYAFTNSGLTSINLPKGIKKIGIGAFALTPNNTSIVLPDSILFIGANAFMNEASAVTSIRINAMDPPVFDAKSSKDVFTPLKKAILYVPEGSVEKYKSADVWNSFDKISSDRLYILKEGQTLETMLGDEAPEAVGRLKYIGKVNENTITNFNKLTRLYDLDCSEAIASEENEDISRLLRDDDEEDDEISFIQHIEKYTMPNTIKEITNGDRGFDEDNVIKEIVLPEGLQSIGEDCFEAMHSLAKINIPSTVKTIEPSAFYDCPLLDSINFNDKIEFIPDMCCMFDFAMQKITLGKDVAEIGEGAFAFCSKVSEIMLPKSLSEIKDMAFLGCFGLKKIYCLREVGDGIEVPVCGEAVFEYLNPSTIELYVPKESIDAYKADETWGQFLIKELDVTSSKTVEPNQCLAFVQNRQLVIQNNGQNFVDTCVFTMEGTLIYQGMSAPGENSISLDEGIYIVKMNDKCQKVIIK